MEFCSFGEFFAFFRANLANRRFSHAYENFLSYIRVSIIHQKNKYLNFYKNDIKASLTDQITHAPLLEFLWVIFPAIILIFIAYPSIILLYYNEAYTDPVFNITVIGNQWFWTYEYNDFNLLKLFQKHISSDKNFFQSFKKTYLDLVYFSSFSRENYLKKDQEITNTIVNNIPQRLTVDCNMIIAKDPKFLRLLTTDQCLVIPAKTPIRFLITSADVIHSWAIPSYGVKLDAVPGRINQQILSVPLMGTSWGQCSELCGVNHAFMPIEIKVLAFSDFLYFIQLKVKEILFPFLETYYREKINFMKKYIKIADNIAHAIERTSWSSGELRPWVLLDRMQWDKCVPASYNLSQMFYLAFIRENAQFREDTITEMKATFLVRRAKLYQLKFYYARTWWILLNDYVKTIKIGSIDNVEFKNSITKVSKLLQFNSNFMRAASHLGETSPIKNIVSYREGLKEFLRWRDLLITIEYHVFVRKEPISTLRPI